VTNLSGVGDDIVWQHPSPRLQTLRQCQVALLGLGALVVAVGVPVVLGQVPLGVALGAGVVVCSFVASQLMSRRVRAWGFAERDEDLLVRRGVMFKRLAVIPYGRMQYLEVTAGPFERTVGLSTVQMHTAAAASDARIPGLPTAEANRLRDQLTQLGEHQATGL